MVNFIQFINTNTLYYYLLISWIIIAVLIFIILLKFKSLKTYGRHVPKNGILLNNRLGWFLMEIPTGPKKIPHFETHKFLQLLRELC